MLVLPVNPGDGLPYIQDTMAEGAIASPCATLYAIPGHTPVRGDVPGTTMHPNPGNSIPHTCTSSSHRPIAPAQLHLQRSCNTPLGNKQRCTTGNCTCFFAVVRGRLGDLAMG